MKNDAAPLDVRKNLCRALFKSLLIPVLTLAFFAAAPCWLNAKLRAEVLHAINGDDKLSTREKSERAETFAHLDFQQVCRDCPPGMEKFRDRLVEAGVAGNFERLRWGLFLSLTLVAGLGLAVGAIFILNARAGRSQSDLISGYQWSWRIGMAAAMAKVFFLIPLLAYGTFEFSVLLTDRYLPKLLLMIVVGGLLALWKSASILLKKIPLEFSEPMARAVTPEEAPELWQAVRSAAERLQTTPPDRILLGLQLNFYVTELAVRHDGGRAEGKTLYLSFPLLKQLSVDEVTAIMGHELGHFIGEDTKMSREFYPLRLKARATMVAMAQSGWIGWPSFQFLNFFSWCFGGTEQAASRARELLADQKAAVLTSPQTAAHALVRFQVAMEAFQYGLKEAVKNQAQNPLDVPLQGIVQEKLAPDAAFWTRLFEKKLPHPLDSHPSLHVRLEALGQTVSVEEARRVALINEESAFEKWFSHRAELFTNLSRQAEAAVEKLRSRTALAAADYQTEAGKRLLEEHFPEKKWPVKQSSLRAILALLGFLAIVNLAAVIFIDNPGARIVFGITLLLLALAMTVKAKRQHKAELVLNADGLYHTGWARPLRFKEVQNISGRRYSSNIILTFHLKEKQPSLWKFCVVRLSANRASLSLSGLDGKPLTIADTIIQYFTRRQAE